MIISLPAAPASMLRRLNEGGFQAYVVGGCVRDALMGRVPHDWDICTDARPEQVIALFGENRVAKTGLQHGTVMVIEEGEGYEITTFRTDGHYSDNRHPDSVRFVGDVRSDLARRDFTINAMAYHPDSGLVDAFGGQEDLRARLVRCVGSAEARFQEDGLRLMRALRFASRFSFALAEETGRAIHGCISLLDKIAAERIFSELRGFLIGPGVGPLLLEYRDLMARILPQLERMFDFEQRNPHHCYDVYTHTVHVVEQVPPETVLRLSALFHDVGKPDCWSRDEKGIDHFYGHALRSVDLAREMLARLRCDNETRDEVLRQVRWHDLPLPQTAREGRRFLHRMGEQGALWSLALHRGDALAQSPEFMPDKLKRLDQADEVIRELLEQKSCFSLKDLAVKGSDLLALGCPKGPAVGRELNWLLEQVLDGTCPNERSALLAKFCEKNNK